MSNDIRNGNGNTMMSWFKIFLPLIITMFIQTTVFAVAWGQLTEKVENLTEQLNELKKKVEKSTDDRYRGLDAKDDFSIRDKRIDGIENKLDDHIKNHTK